MLPATKAVFLCNLFCTYKVTGFLLVKIFFSSTRCRLMKLKFVILLLPVLSSWQQQLLKKTCGVRCENRLMVSQSFAFR